MRTFAVIVLALSLLALSSEASPRPKSDDDDANEVLQADNGYVTYGSVNKRDSQIYRYSTAAKPPVEPKSGSSLLETIDADENDGVLSVQQQPARPGQTVMASSGDVEKLAGSPNGDKFKSIAFNGREVRLVGSQQREVEMDDSVKSKLLVALDNLQKEATDVWGQVNEKLDKGLTDLKRSDLWGQMEKSWKELKTNVEGVVAPSSSRP